MHPHLMGVIQTVGLQKVDNYIKRQQNEVSEWVNMRPIIDIYHQPDITEGRIRTQKIPEGGN